MNRYQLIIFFAYLAVQGTGYWLTFINIKYMKKHGLEVPPGFEEHIDKTVLKKTHEYTIETNNFSLMESVFDTVLLLLFLYGGVLNIYNSWLVSLDLSFIMQGLVFALLLSFAGSIISIPFSLYSTFHIEKKYGFNTTTPAIWIADFAKSFVLSAVIMGVVISCGLWIVQKSPDHWWFFVWSFFFVFSVFMMYVSPYIIEPLFNKFTPLEGHEPEESIRAMMAKSGIKVSRVFTMDASKRSRHTNAYFTGIGRVKRIVLYDTLIQMMTTYEILAVLAHEVGHWKKKHVLKMLALFEALSLAAAYAAFIVLRSDYLNEIFRIDRSTFFAKIVIIGFIYGIISFPFTPLFSYLSRRHENEADRFAVELSPYPEALATSLIKLSKDNLSNLHPHPIYASFYYSHPPVVERVKRIKDMTNL